MGTNRPSVSTAGDGREGGSSRCEILGIPIDLVDYDEAFARIQGWRASGSRQFVVIATAADVHLSRDAGLREASRLAGMSLPDGISVVMAARLLGRKTKGRVTGPDLMLRVCDWGREHGYRHYFYGSTEDVVRRLKERLTRRYPGLEIAGSYCPPFHSLTPEEEEEVVRDINASRPDVVWIGLGGTKQIRWMSDHVDRIEAPVLIGVGAAFNFHSGVVRRAPSWIQRLGMEWIYRTLTEPCKIVPRTRYTLMFGVRAVAQASAWRLARWSGSL